MTPSAARNLAKTVHLDYELLSISGAATIWDLMSHVTVSDKQKQPGNNHFRVRSSRNVGKEEQSRRGTRTFDDPDLISEPEPDVIRLTELRRIVNPGTRRLFLNKLAIFRHIVQLLAVKIVEIL